MIHNRTPEEVRRYDIFKLVVLLLLLILISFMLFRENDSLTLATTEGEEAASEIETTQSETEAVTPAAEEGDQETEGETSDLEGSASETEMATSESEVAEGEGDVAGSVEGEGEIAAPSLLSPAPGAEMEAGTITFSGTGVPNSTVSILADGTEIGQTQVDADGNWHLEGEVEAGEPTIELLTLDSEGNVTASSELEPFVVVAGEESTATPNLILNEMGLYAGSVSLSGSGEPGQSIVIMVDGQEAGTAEVDENGNWSMPLELVPGDPAINLQTVDENGDVINEAGPFEITVQEAILPTVDLPDSDVYTGGMTLTGTGQPGTQVQLYANELVISVANVDADGNYSIEVNLEVGRYNIDVAGLDDSGNLGGDSSSTFFAGSRIAQSEFFTLSDLNNPEFDPLSGLESWRGTADPDSSVVLIANGEIVVEATADAEGNWSIESDLDPGSYEFALGYTDAEGNITAESEPVPIDLNEEAPYLDLPEHIVSESAPSDGAGSEPSIQLPAGEFGWTGQGAPNSTVAVIVNDEIVGTAVSDADGNWTVNSTFESGEYDIQLGLLDSTGTLISQSEIVTLNVADMSPPTILSQELDTRGQGTISGTADPGTTVTLTANGKIAGITTTGEDGIWSMNVNLGTGSFDLQVQVFDEEGEVALSSEKQSIEVSATTDSAEGEDDVIDAAATQGNFSTLLAGLKSCRTYRTAIRCRRRVHAICSYR